MIVIEDRGVCDEFPKGRQKHITDSQSQIIDSSITTVRKKLRN
jgi:hypothetical protein